MDVGNLISGSSAFSKTSLNIWNFTVHILPKPGLENFEHYFTSVWDDCNCVVVWAFFDTALPNSMKLWAKLCRGTQDRRVLVESSDKTWSSGEGNDKPLQYSCLENPMNSMKRQKDKTLKMNSPRQQVPNTLLEIRGEITPERMKWWSQSKNSTQLWMWLVIEARSDAVKSNIA